MSKFINQIVSFIKTIKNKIAFYPAVLSLVGFAFSLFMIILEQKGISKYLIDVMPMLVIQDGDTALTVLSICTGGLISMMVFSFSMVMLLLSQASSNFSPRLLPGLISDKPNQIILGLYLSTIVYNVFTMLSIEPTGDKYTLPGFSVLLGVLATIVCLAAFIYFIHNMSQSIQISFILDTIFEKAKTRLEYMIKYEEKNDNQNHDIPTTDAWYSYKCFGSGYFQGYRLENIIDFCKNEDTQIVILKPKGLFVLKDEAFIKSKIELSQNQLKTLYACFYFSRNELVEENYNLAFKQIVEIIVKAMSPGINDPGTALNGIDYLTELLALRLQKNDIQIIADMEESCFYGLAKVISFEDLLNNIMASLRTYCKHDPIIIQKLLYMLKYLKQQSMKKPDHIKIIHEQMTILIEQSKSVFETDKDKALILEMAND